MIETDRFIDGYQSRNERLTDLMRRLKICEERSSGIDRVVAEAEVHQLPAPDFRLGPTQTYAVLFAPLPFEDTTREDRLRACYQHACLRHVTSQVMTNSSLRDRFQLPSDQNSTASRVIRDTLRARLNQVGGSGQRLASVHGVPPVLGLTSIAANSSACRRFSGYYNKNNDLIQFAPVARPPTG